MKIKMTVSINPDSRVATANLTDMATGYTKNFRAYESSEFRSTLLAVNDALSHIRNKKDVEIEVHGDADSKAYSYLKNMNAHAREWANDDFMYITKDDKLAKYKNNDQMSAYIAMVDGNKMQMKYKNDYNNAVYQPVFG